MEVTYMGAASASEPPRSLEEIEELLRALIDQVDIILDLDRFGHHKNLDLAVAHLQHAYDLIRSDNS
jgi:hypothetical protein